MKKVKKVLIIILIIVVILLLPLIFKSKGRIEIAGPDLSQMKYTEIYFKNDVESIKLAGMLFKPEGKGPFPTAVLIHGSGPSSRNSVWYLSVAKHLKKNGIAIVLPDKRGCEKSEGKWLGASFDELANDVVGSIEYVKNQSDFTYSSIGIVGLSQGGWIAPVAAAKTTGISFIASISGPTVTTDEQLLYEVVNNTAPYTYTFIAKLIAPIVTNNLKKKPFFVPFAGFDPIPYWKKVNVPVFLGFGENDKNVPVELCLDRLKENNLNDFKTKVYPEGGHGIIDIETKKMNPEYLNDLTVFIKESR